ncbi:MAG: AAA family ATPase [Acetobacter sp.]|nr:AAA family ATPase [Bacteroides sp.]MCM1340860.1 AAA family ATPase [Acetobacter sp.]MCM1432583.1 AAA family ATPase [Clostridiales bacterium]
MPKKITKIVITGGPCSGKSTALPKIKKEFESIGYSVVFVHELAAELINSGLSPVTYKSRFNFQANLFKMQIEKEKIFQKASEALPNEKILIICDRGVLDGKAYLTEEEFSTVINEVNSNEIELRDSYDAVFHLVTSANGTEEFYTTENNKTRTENIKQAIEIDNKLISAWTGHPHFRIIDNSTDFNGKIKRLNAEIASFLGEPEPLEIERKYLIEYPDINMLEKNPYCQKVDISQSYIKTKDGNKFRIRRRGLNGNYIYFKTCKKRISATTRIEIEERLTKEEYDSILENPDNSKNTIEKSRYCLCYNTFYFEIDVYPFWSDKAVMEIELLNENQEVIFPDFIKIIKEVTEDKRYSNHSLSISHNI